MKNPEENNPIYIEDEVRWKSILNDFFPDGYILCDFICQSQANTFWSERYNESCPIEGDEIDAVMKVIGCVRDGRVVSKDNDDNSLIIEICSVINEILSRYTCVERNIIYEHFRCRLVAQGIYTEELMSQLLLKACKGVFYSTRHFFARQGNEVSVVKDCRQVLRDYGGAMSVDDIENKLWFVSSEHVYHSLLNDPEILNIGARFWMLAEHFPITRKDAEKIGYILDSFLILHGFILQTELLPLLRQKLPSIGQNLSELELTAVFNILKYYLNERFSFSKTIISPKGAKIDFSVIFNSFAKKHDKFTLEDLSLFASDLNIKIYWESLFNGGAVRINENEFVHRSMISFDIDSTDKMLENFCIGDYLSLKEIHPAMWVHFPKCEYKWNGFLLQSYLYGFSKKFILSYNNLSKSDYCGAMVRRSCTGIYSYDHLVVRVLSDAENWKTESEALMLLVKKGYQSRQRLKGIDKLVVKAQKNKLSQRR